MRAWHGIAAASLAVTLGGAAGVAPAQDKWPSKPMRMIVPFTSGSASDVTGRIVAQRLTEIYGQQIVIDNRPGAGGLIGSELVRQAAPDGYTVAMIGQPHLSNALLRSEKPYDPLKDFLAIGLVAVTPNVIVLGKGVEAKTIPDLIALAKTKPGALNYGSAGIGSSSHLAGAMFVSKAKINVVHVPFRQGPDSRSALITGTIHFYLYPLPAIVTMLKAGTLKALAVASAKRAGALPNVPTSAEAGFPEYKSESWFGLIGPRGLPRRVIAKINADTMSVLKEPATQQKFALQGAEPGSGSPEHFAKMQRDEYAELGALIKAIGMKAQ
ncbi:MAG: tripartite tricarboxylate transporter substrate binding protein [Betaproteobacteria bacterium]|nr:tripartite tricarboxylate transporter substrate binding protein [Betaproteobacteria bacterium]MBI2227327.1 tripartite tricarboxylate transporter substrate binding protein [Betaproteobacteria bacterium]MBI3052527.1 tripartite tricarboxylate transporter substrate binding protein [Betaproteobacteria bacterium]